VGAQGKCPCLRQLHGPKRRRHLSENLNLQQQRCEKSNIPTVCFDFVLLSLALAWKFTALYQLLLQILLRMGRWAGITQLV
jgi:hypothetical protein